jgi:hypothetical protein
MILAAVAAATLTVVVTSSRGDGEPRVPTAKELEAYEAAVTEPAKRGGFVVQEGLKRGLADVASGNAGPVVFQAVSWAEELRGVQVQFNAQAHLAKGTRLEPATKTFDAAFEFYIETAQTIGAAAIASDASRETLLERASASGRRADATYDEASFLLQRLRKQRGLDITARFPSPASEDE